MCGRHERRQQNRNGDPVQRRRRSQEQDVRVLGQRKFGIQLGVIRTVFCLFAFFFFAKLAASK